MKSYLLVLFILFSDFCFAQYRAPEIRVQIGHTDIITQTALSPDGKHALSASWDKTIKLWEVVTGRLVRTFEGHDGRVYAICFSSDGSKIFSGGEDGKIISWDISTGDILGKYEGHKNEIFSIAISPVGSILASASGAEIKIWDISTKELIKTVMGSTGTISKINFSPDGKYIIATSHKELVMWSVSTGEVEREFDNNRYGHFYPVFSPDGRYILTGSGDRIIKLWDAGTGELVRTFEGSESRVTSVAFSPDGKRIISGCDDHSVVFWDVSNSQVISSFNSHNGEVRSVCFTPDGEYVLSSSGTEIMLSESETGRMVKAFEGRTNSISSIVFTPDGKYILTGCFDNTLKLWEVSTGKLIRIFEGHEGIIKSIDVSSDGKYAISGSADSKVGIWDISTAKLVRVLEGHKDIVTSVKFSPDNNFVLSSSWDNTVKLWDLSDGRLIHTFQGHQWYVTSVAFSPNGKYMISGGYDNKINLWEVSRKKLLRSFDYSDRITTVSFSPDGEKILSGSCNNILVLWDINTGKVTRSYEGHSYCVSSAVFTPDGERIISGSDDRTLKLWDVYSGKNLRTFEGHTNTILSVCISSDGERIFSSSADNKMKLWDLKSGTEIASFITYYDKDYIVITPDNYYLSSKNGVKVIAFVIGNNAYPPEQYDLNYNRPDIVLGRIGLAPRSLIDAYHRAYIKRLKKMNFKEDMFNNDFQLPEVRLLTERIPLVTENKNLSFEIRADDAKYNLDRLNVYINDVPIYGCQGINLRDYSSNTYQTELNVELSKKKNKIQISAVNEKGVESLYQTFNVSYESKATKPDLYLVTIAASGYKDKKYNLLYAAKDANDIAELMNENREKYNEIRTMRLINEDVSRENILKVKDFLMQSKVDDEVIIFIAGHGVLSKSFDYYFATYDMDFTNPESRGVTFEDLERLLDAIPARKKVLLMDTCHSGEVDKEDIQEVKKKRVEKGEVLFRNIGESEYTYKDEKRLGLKYVGYLLQDMFVDLRRGSGAIIISSSGGLEFAWEGGGYKNGLFTYCLIEGLKTKNADINKDLEVSVGELQGYVSDRVVNLTDGAQRPTYRRESLDFDFIIW